MPPQHPTNEPNSNTPPGEDTPDNERPADAHPSTLRAPLTTDLNRRSLPISARNGPRDPLDKYTHAPMPKIYDGHPTDIFSLIDLKVIDEWDSYPACKLFALPFGIEARVQSRHNSIRARIFAAAAEITQSQQMGVSAPKPSEKARRQNYTPSAFLIYNLTEAQRNTLLEKTVWSSVDISFRVALPEPNLPDFLFSIKGFCTLAKDLVRNMVAEVWQDEETQTSLQAISRAASNNGHADSQTNIKAFTESLEVKRLDVKERGNILAPRFNIHAESKYIKDHNVWAQIRDFLASRQYTSNMLGRGTTRVAPYECGICYSVDHPRGLCPFPSVAGWNGPTWRPESEGPRSRGKGSRGGPSRRSYSGWK